jgi:hypothetical protein
MAYYMHWYHFIERNVDLGLAIGQHFMLFQSLNGIDILDSLDCPIKWQGVYSTNIAWNLWILKEWKYLNEEKTREIKLK